MTIIYDIVFIIFAIFTLPFYALRGKLNRQFLLRFGSLPKEFSLKRPVWVHAVSVGEALAVRAMALELKKRLNEEGLFITTVTPTGNKIAQSAASGRDAVGYLPIDLSFCVRRFLSRLDPRFCLLAETEIWPNLLFELSRRKVPTVVVNARISDRSFFGYSLFKFFISPVFNKVNMFLVQSEQDAHRLRALGVRPEKINVTGNMKFDMAAPVAAENARDLLGLLDNERLLVAGSTHRGEERAVLSVYRELQKIYPELKLLIAPRHPERAGEVSKIVSSFGLRPVLVSGLPKVCATCQTVAVFVLDTVGKLSSLYEASDAVFVGGSLVKKGGHNILEPAFFAKPVFFGKEMFNFRDIAELFTSLGAGVQVRDEEELFLGIKEILADRQKAAELGRKARELIGAHRGATVRNLEIIEKMLSGAR